MVNTSATVAPGNSPGVLSVAGQYIQGASGTLEIEIGGIISGSQYDVLNITGAALLGGTLDVSLIDSFLPTLGDSFGILSAAGGISGTYSSEMLPLLASGLAWNVNYDTLNDLVSLEVVSEFSADFDSNGSVDGVDLAQWDDDFGINGDSDTDEDGDSDGADFLAWQRQFGSGVSPLASSSTAVPEPTSACLALILSCILFLAPRQNLWVKWRGNQELTAGFFEA